MGEDIAEEIQEQLEEREKGPLNTIIALSVALTATFMAICNVKSGNVVHKMQAVQTETVDTWSYYQAKSTKQGVSESFAEDLQLQRDSTNPTPELKAAYDKEIARLKGKVDKYEKEKEDLKKKADDLGAEYEKLNFKNDQFDAGEASSAVGIALLGITALTKRRWLLIIAAIAVSFAILMGLSGFMGWSFNPAWLSKLLGA